MKELMSYMNDHLAGAVAALELLDHLIRKYQGQPLEKFLVDLRDDIEADRDELRNLVGTTRAQGSIVRKIAAWIAEKMARSKFKIAGEAMGELGLVQALETLALGIRGKELLWRALAASNFPATRGVDLAKLERRAIDQQERVEEKRLAAACEAFR
jgi:hypothetical protein